MVQTKNKWASWLLIILLGLMTNPVAVSAEATLSFSEALQEGLKYNQDLQQAQRNLTSIRRDLAKIEADLGWNMDVTSSYHHNFNQDISTPSNPNNIKLNTSKTWENGLSIGPSVELDFDELSPSVTFSASMPILPRTPSQPVRLMYRNQAELIKAEADMGFLTAQKITEWLDTYLSLVRSQQQLTITNERLNLAKQEYDRTLARAEIHEASDEEIINAELHVLERQLQLERQLATNEANKLAFYHELGLPNQINLGLEEDFDLVNKMNLLVEDLPNYDIGLEIILNNHPDILAHSINQELLELELEWLLAENNLDLSTSLTYNSAQSNTTISINGSYNLWDGGKRRIDIDTQKDTISNADTQLDSIKFGLEQDLLGRYNNYRFMELELDQEKIRLNNSKTKLEIAAIQYDAGVIDALTYQETVLNHNESLINYSIKQDQLLIAKLQLATMFNPNPIIEEVTP